MKQWILAILVFSSFYCQQEQAPATSTEPTATQPNQKPKPRMVFLGDSLTAGRGLAGNHLAFPALLGQMLQQNQNLEFEIVNAGVSGDTTSGGLTRLDWLLEQPVAYFIVELGANDAMRGVLPRVIEQNLNKIIQIVQKKYPTAKILLLPMRAFPNMGPQYSKTFAAIYDRVAARRQVALSAFILQKVAGIPRLNQEDGIHPTAEGHRLMAETIYPDILRLINSP